MQDLGTSCISFNSSQSDVYWFDDPGTVQLQSVQSTYYNTAYFDCSNSATGFCMQIDPGTSPADGWTVADCPTNNGNNGLCEMGKISTVIAFIILFCLSLKGELQ